MCDYLCMWWFICVWTEMVKYKEYEPEVSAVTCLLLFLCSHLFGWWCFFVVVVVVVVFWEELCSMHKQKVVTHC